MTNETAQNIVKYTVSLLWPGIPNDFDGEFPTPDDIVKELQLRIAPTADWPKYTDNTNVKFGDYVPDVGTVEQVNLFKDGSFSLCHGFVSKKYMQGQRVNKEKEEKKCTQSDSKLRYDVKRCAKCGKMPRVVEYKQSVDGNHDTRSHVVCECGNKHCATIGDEKKATELIPKDERTIEGTAYMSDKLMQAITAQTVSSWNELQRKLLLDKYRYV